MGFKLKQFTVTDITNRIRILLETDAMLKGICVIGEVSSCRTNHRQNRSYTFFSIKDEKHSIKAVYFGELTDTLMIGDQVVIYGSLMVYGAGGEYQINVQSISHVGEGDNKKQLELLRKKLEKKGYFSSERKRPIPRYIKKVAVITSATGAAIQDFMKTLQQNKTLVMIDVYDSAVQGKCSPEQITDRIHEINQVGGYDEILITRGGGSKEDLEVFHHEMICNAVVESQIPIHTAVGHEIDTTLVDYCADWVSITPTAAAELVASRSSAMYYQQQINQPLMEMTQRITARLSQEKKQLEEGNPVAMQRLLLDKLQQKKSFIRNLTMQMTAHMNESVQHQSNEIALEGGKLEAMSPLKVLQRGYSLVSTAGQLVTKATVLSNGDVIDIQFDKGRVRAKVNEVIEHE